MAQKDAIIRSLEHRVEEQQREIENLKEEGMNSNISDEGKLKEFENKLVELENLVKGLTDEFLDLKSIVMKMAKAEEERTPKAPKLVKSAPPVEGREIGKPQPQREVKPGGDTALIMQADGTLKPEKRQTEGIITAINRPNNTMSGGRTASSRRSNEEIIIGKRKVEKRDKSPLIYAEEDDSEEIRK